MTVSKGRKRTAKPAIQQAGKDVSRARRAVTRTGRGLKNLYTGTIRAVEQASKLAVGLVSIIGIGLLLFTLGQNLWGNTMMIDPIDVPKVMADMGYTDQAATLQLHDALQVIIATDGAKPAVLAGMIASAPKRPIEIVPRSEQVDIAAPGTGLSISSLAQMVRRLLNMEQNRISGEFLCPAEVCSTRDLILRIRLVHLRKTVVISRAVGTTGFDRLFKSAAEGVAREIDPNALVHALADIRIEEAEEIADEMARNSHPNRAAAENRVGIGLYNQEKYEDAIAWFKRAAAGKDGLPEAHAHLGIVYLEGIKDYGLAEAEFETAVKLGADKAASYVGWGDALAAQKKFELAYQRYRAALNVDRNFADAYIAWGDALSVTRSTHAAIAKYKRAAAIDPALTDAYVSIGDIHSSVADWDKAMEMYRQAIAADPNSTLAHFRVGEVLDVQGKASEAIASFNAAAAIPPRLAPRYFKRGRSLRSIATRQPTEPGLRVGQLIRSAEDPQYAALMRAAGLHLRGSNGKKAAETYCRAAAIAPHLASDTYINWSSAFASMDPPQIRLALAKASEAMLVAAGELAACSDRKSGPRRGKKATDPQIAAAYVAVADILLRQENPDLKKVLHLVKRAAKLDTKSAQARMMWGVALQWEEKPDAGKIQEQHEAALRLDPYLAESFFYWGKALDRWGHAAPGAVLEKYREAVAILPNYPEAYLNIAELDARSSTAKLPEEASMNFALAAKFAPAQANVYLRWGNALRNVRDYRGAIEKYEQARHRGPGFEARWSIAETYFAWGNQLMSAAAPDYEQASATLKAAFLEAGLEDPARRTGCEKPVMLGPLRAGAPFYNCGAAEPDVSPAADAYLRWADGIARWAAATPVKDTLFMYREAAARRPGDAVAYLRWGDALRLNGDHAGAAAKYEEAVRLSPKYAEAHFRWAEALRAMGEYGRAIGRYQETIDLEPGHANAYFGLGWSLGARYFPDHRSAIEKCRKAAELEPRHVFAHYCEGYNFEMLGDTASAIDAYETHLRIDPAGAVHESARERLGKLRQAGVKPEANSADIRAR